MSFLDDVLGFFKISPTRADVNKIARQNIRTINSPFKIYSYFLANINIHTGDIFSEGDQKLSEDAKRKKYIEYNIDRSWTNFLYLYGKRPCDDKFRSLLSKIGNDKINEIHDVVTKNGIDGLKDYIKIKKNDFGILFAVVYWKIVIAQTIFYDEKTNILNEAKKEKDSANFYPHFSNLILTLNASDEVFQLVRTMMLDTLESRRRQRYETKPEYYNELTQILDYVQTTKSTTKELLDPQKIRNLFP